MSEPIKQSKGLKFSRFNDGNYSSSDAKDAVHTMQALLPIINPIEKQFDGFRNIYLHSGFVDKQAVCEIKTNRNVTSIPHKYFQPVKVLMHELFIATLFNPNEDAVDKLFKVCFSKNLEISRQEFLGNSDI